MDINDGKINLLVLNRENIFCEIKFLICIHEIPSVKFAIFETQFAKASSLEIFSLENIFQGYYSFNKWQGPARSKT